MELNEIIERLSVFGQDQPVPREALAEAVRQKEAITPVLLEALDWLHENVRKRGSEVYDEPEYDRSWYAFFLLAQFREERAFPKLIRLLKLNKEHLEIALGDVIADAGNMLYSTYNGDLAAAKAVAADAGLAPYARGAALNLMQGLFCDGRMDREDLVGFIRERLSAIGRGGDEEIFAAMLAECVAAEDLFELTEDVRKIYRLGKADTMFLGDFDGFLDALFEETPPERQPRFIDDAITEFSGWACFQKGPLSKPTIGEILSWKVGRNEPCPCGSGLKFKKCCLPKKLEWERLSSDEPSLEMDRYPSVEGSDGRPGLGNFYNQDAITVDKLAYQALKLLHFPPSQRYREEWRQSRKQAADLLWKAFQETLRICAEKGLETPEDFDREHKVHYYSLTWLDQLLDLLRDFNDPRRREVEAFVFR